MFFNSYGDADGAGVMPAACFGFRGKAAGGSWKPGEQQETWSHRH